MLILMLFVLKASSMELNGENKKILKNAISQESKKEKNEELYQRIDKWLDQQGVFEEYEPGQISYYSSKASLLFAKNNAKKEPLSRRFIRKKLPSLETCFGKQETIPSFGKIQDNKIQDNPLNTNGGRAKGLTFDVNQKIETEKLQKLSDEDPTFSSLFLKLEKVQINDDKNDNKNNSYITFDFIQGSTFNKIKNEERKISIETTASDGDQFSKNLSNIDCVKIKATDKIDKKPIIVYNELAGEEESPNN